jgi:hypothetical protein
MDEINQNREIDILLRDVAVQRDKRLGKQPALSVARETTLNDFLAREFPVETTLAQVATKRDRLLDLHAGIPAAAEKAMSRHFAAGEPAPHRIQGGALSAGAHNGWWSRLFRFSRSAALTTCILIAVAILCFGMWGRPSAHHPENFSRTSPIDGTNLESAMTLRRLTFGRAELFTRTASIRPFNLNTNEPASLQASLLPNNPISLIDGKDGPLGLRLDLTLRTSLTEDISPELLNPLSNPNTL